jgi:hypothetical protein
MNRHTILALAFLAIVGAAGAASAQPTGCSSIPPGILDPTFEAGTPWAQWTVQSSTVFGTPICDLPTCGTGGGLAAPFAGDNWAWFGGISAVENSTLGQSVVFPATTFLFLRFQMRIGAVSAPLTDTLTISVSGTPVATFTEPAVAEPGYTERFVDVSAFANGTSRPILFTYAHAAGPVADFTIDNFELVACTTPVELMDYKIE